MAARYRARENATVKPLMGRIVAIGLVVYSLVACASVIAAERKAYKYVDEKGNVTYSQTPPSGETEAKKIDISPAQSGRGGYTPPASQYNNPGAYSNESQRQQYNDALRERQKRQEEAQKKRLAELEAECNRNRGTDCKNADTLRYQESTRIPSGRRY